MIDIVAPGLALRAFLSERRKRVDPQELGLPLRRSRRGGLRREDLAELLDVSLLWYALFESGTSGRRFSATFLKSVATVLRLDDAEYALMMRLVVESDHAAQDLEMQWMELRWKALCADAATAVRQIADAQSADRAGEAAIRAVSVIVERLGLDVSAQKAACLHVPAQPWQRAQHPMPRLLRAEPQMSIPRAGPRPDRALAQA